MFIIIVNLIKNEIFCATKRFYTELNRKQFSEISIPFSKFKYVKNFTLENIFYNSRQISFYFHGMINAIIVSNLQSYLL